MTVYPTTGENNKMRKVRPVRLRASARVIKLRFKLRSDSPEPMLSTTDHQAQPVIQR